MFRVLEEILCRNPVTGRTSVASHGEIFLVHLERVAANADTGAVTVECLVAGRTVTSVQFRPRERLEPWFCLMTSVYVEVIPPSR